MRGRACLDSSQRRRYGRPHEVRATCASATAYPALDTFGRTRRILWKDGAFAPGSTAGEPSRPPLVELAYAFDHASNLVAKADGRYGSSRKRDEQYTLDGLMRLLKARRGDFTGADPAPGAFVAAPGTQKYQYDFVGNIRSTDILANASEQQSAADRKLTASFNAVNEQTNYVETVGGGGSLGSTFAITHDAAGNVRTRETVAGGNRLAYRHDRWGRLTEVKFEVRSGSSYLANDRARYRYNALGMRALVERDADTTDPTNAINERRYLYYNAAWQIVEEHVDAGVTAANAAASLTAPSIDRIVQNIWGLRYIDDLVLRRVDANYPGSGPPSFAETASGDIDWEQYLTDHQFSVVAAVGRTGTLAFRVAYDAYGEARHLPAKDINGDGKVDSADTAIAQAASGRKLGAAGYNPDADWDRDGTVTSTDIAQFGSRSYAAALPQGQLAQPGGATQPAAGDVSPSANLARAANARSDFNIGFSGYRFNGDIGAYTVRFRHYDPTPGMCRWLERDPAGYHGCSQDSEGNQERGRLEGQAIQGLPRKRRQSRGQPGNRAGCLGQPKQLRGNTWPMNDDDVSIKVSAKSAELLAKTGLLLPSDSPALWEFEPLTNGMVLLRLRRAMTEPIRAALTVQLAEIGFDENYNLTAEGALIEDLIDRLFVP